jgi:MFS family permease
MMKTDEARRYENALVGILFFTWGTVFLDRMSQLYLAPDIAREFHLSHEQIGLLASVLAITWAASSLFFGAVSDRVGRRKILIPAVFIFSLLSWVSGTVHSFHQLLLVRALMGLAEGPTWSTMTALIEESSLPSRRGRNIGIVVSAAALVGLAVAPVMTTQVASRFGWRWAFFIAGIPGLFMGAVIWRFVKEPQRDTEDSPHHQAVTLRDYFSVLRYRNIWLCCIAAAGFVSWLFLQNVFCAALSDASGASALDDGRVLPWGDRFGEFFSGISFALPVGSLGPQAGVVFDGGAVGGGADRLPGFVALFVPVVAGGDFVSDEYGAGIGSADHGAGADGKRSGAICGDVDRTGNVHRRDRGRHRGSRAGRGLGREAGTRNHFVAVGGGKRSDYAGRGVSERDGERAEGRGGIANGDGGLKGGAGAERQG